MLFHFRYFVTFQSWIHHKCKCQALWWLPLLFLMSHTVSTTWQALKCILVGNYSNKMDRAVYHLLSCSCVHNLCFWRIPQHLTSALFFPACLNLPFWFLCHLPAQLAARSVLVNTSTELQCWDGEAPQAEHQKQAAETGQGHFQSWSEGLTLYIGILVDEWRWKRVHSVQYSAALRDSVGKAAASNVILHTAYMRKRIYKVNTINN